MARKRMIDPDIWTDRKTLKLTAVQLLVWIGCISNADDEGILDINPEKLYFDLARRDLEVEDIECALEAIISLKLIVPYGDFAFMPSWYKRQTLNRPSQTKLKRPPAEIVKQYPAYIDGWEEAFTKWQGKGDQREKISIPYPLDRNSLNTHEQFSESSVNAHGSLSESTVSTHPEKKRIEENRREEKGIERKRKEFDYMHGDPADPAPEKHSFPSQTEDDGFGDLDQPDIPKRMSSINGTMIGEYGRHLSADEIPMVDQMLASHTAARICRELCDQKPRAPDHPIHYVHSILEKVPTTRKQKLPPVTDFGDEDGGF